MGPLIALGAMAGANLLSGIMQGRAANAGATAANAAAVQANLTNTIRTAARASLVAAQTAQAAKVSAQSGFDLTKQKRTAMGAAVANAAASGTVGASVDAVQDEIEKAAAEVEANRDYEWEVTQENAVQALADTVTMGTDALQRGVRVQSGTSQALGLLLGAAASTAANYYTSKMNLGLGAQNGATRKPGP